MKKKIILIALILVFISLSLNTVIYADTDLQQEFLQASINGDRFMVELAIEAGVDVNATDQDGYTALMTTASHGDASLMEILIDNGANINHSANDGFTALMYATLSEVKAAIELLINNGANVNAKNNYNQTALIYASSTGNYEIVDLLINNDANINISEDNGNTPLILSSRSGNQEVVKKLLSEGAEFNTNNSGDTALINAAAFGHPEIVELLINHGADINHKNDEGKTALDWAKEQENDKSVEIIENFKNDEPDDYLTWDNIKVDYYEGSKMTSSLSVIDSYGEEKVLSSDPASEPKISPSGRFLSYIAPYGFEGIGELYLYDHFENKLETIVDTSDLSVEHTIEDFWWLDEDTIIFIERYAYGSMSIGGDLYKVNLEDNETSKVFSPEEPRRQVKDIELKEEEITMKIAEFDEDYIDYEIIEKTLESKATLSDNNEEVISEKAIGDMVLVEAGSKGGVTIDHNFYIGKYHVTQSEFEKVMGFNPSYFNDNDHSNLTGNSDYRPVEQVTWYDAVKYANKLSEREGLDKYYNISNIGYDDDHIVDATVTENEGANGYRLPTEDEHEYAARGGKNGNPTTYAGNDNLDEVGWYEENSHEANSDRSDKMGTMPAGEKESNELGIYDMSGNVFEWTNTELDSARVFCGGSWYHEAYGCEVSVSINVNPSASSEIIGFRLVRSL